MRIGMPMPCEVKCRRVRRFHEIDICRLEVAQRTSQLAASREISEPLKLRHMTSIGEGSAECNT